MTEISYSGQGRIAHLICPGPGVVSQWLDPRGPELLALGAVYLNKKRLVEDAPVAAGDYLRVHLQPRRYALPEAIRVLHADDAFVIVDKPAGLPVPPTVDNLRENVAAAAERQLGQPLFVTHRLDTPTRGLLVLAKSAKAQARFNTWLAERRIEKWYRALVKRPLAPGSVVHYQRPDRYAPKEVSAEARDGWLRCELTVLDCQARGENHELTMRLETGRTHQIRCQLAALGNPILGDTLYDGTGGAPSEIALQACALFLPSPGQAWHLDRPWA